jgi:hypothetical protein
LVEWVLALVIRGDSGVDRNPHVLLHKRHPI